MDLQDHMVLSFKHWAGFRLVKFNYNYYYYY